MPELPEVESARALIAEHGLGREIVAVDDTDTYVCRPHAPGEIADALVGHTLTDGPPAGQVHVDRDRRRARSLGLHLGMAGRIVIDDEAAGDYWSDGGRKHLPVWDRFTLRFADGGWLALRDKRRLGRAILDPRLDRLGPDAAEVARDAFRERVGRGEAPLKARIMDQSVIAGVGNLLADEALWRAKLDPRRPAGGARRRPSSTACAARSAPPPAARSSAAASTPATSSPTAPATASARAAAPTWRARPSAAAPRTGAARRTRSRAACPHDAGRTASSCGRHRTWRGVPSARARVEDRHAGP